jgi:hypothetical protein
MTLDASIYSQLRPIKMPSVLESATQAASLSGMGLQQQRAQQQMAQEQKDAQLAKQQQRLHIMGGALDALTGMPEMEQAKVYPQFRKQLMDTGLFDPTELPEQFDRGLIRTAASSVLPMYRQSKEFLARRDATDQHELTQAKIAEAKRGPGADPLARQMMLADYRDQLSRKRDAEERELERTKRDEEVKRYSQVGGWQLSEGATPTQDDAKKFKSGVSAARGLLENLNEYQTLVEYHGSEMGGKVAQRMESLARDIQLAAKNEDLYGLGVLTGPDLQILEEIIAAPTGLGAKLDPFSGSRAANKTQQFRDMLNTKINAKAKTFGFEPQQEWREIAEGRKKKEGEGFGPSAHAGGRPQPSPEDVEAMHWLKKNEGSPDAAGVRKRLQRKGLL